jgi:hypothetical protein
MYNPIRTESVAFVSVVNWPNWYKIRFHTTTDRIRITRTSDRSSTGESPKQSTKVHKKFQKTDSLMCIITSTSWLGYEEVLDAGHAVTGCQFSSNRDYQTRRLPEAERPLKVWIDLMHRGHIWSILIAADGDAVGEALHRP